MASENNITESVKKSGKRRGGRSVYDVDVQQSQLEYCVSEEILNVVPTESSVSHLDHLPGGDTEQDGDDMMEGSHPKSSTSDLSTSPGNCQHFVYMIQRPDEDNMQEASQLMQDEVNQETFVTVFDDCGTVPNDNGNEFCWTLLEEGALKNNWDHPFDDPERLLLIPQDASVEEKKQIWKVCRETQFLESLASGIDKPLSVVRDKARSVFIQNTSTSRKSSTLSTWSATEIKQLENNWKEFFREHPMNEPYELLSPLHLLSKERHSQLMKFKRQTSFLQRLAQGIHRSSLSIYHKAKRHFYPYTEFSGK
ncbi:hypothetical protein LSH36_156g09039 [Paralvinella palmiformis]|uniref:Uncharacterized protein n=1 Tax=Paralvinella palmiformis TaxID=53620 RepID=A0AAD9JTQ7_9ANNE|nr:hypothetical protein LSH36_156g09039 [Paralvinella palmiformis]